MAVHLAEDALLEELRRHVGDSPVGPRLNLRLHLHGTCKSEIGNLGNDAIRGGRVGSKQHIPARQIPVYDPSRV